MTLATKLEAYIQGLVISQGRLAGQPFKLLPWQRRYLKGGLQARGHGRGAFLWPRLGKDDIHKCHCGGNGGRGRASCRASC